MSYDFIFAGAGPAGLTGAICAAGQRRRCIVIEKKSSLDLHPRGETLRHRPILDEILGEGVMETLAKAKTSFIEYYAPEPDKVEKIAINMSSTNISFEWDEWMRAFRKQIDTLGIDLVLEAEVVGIMEKSGVVIGVVYRDSDGNDVLVTGDVVFACDGHKSTIGQKSGVDYQSLNYPIIKARLKNAMFDTSGFKFFFVPESSMDFAPEFPPSIAFLFPRDKANCEAGLMIMARASRKLKYELPDQVELLRVWEQLVQYYPVFSDMLKEATVEMQEATMLPMAGPMSEVIPLKGVVLLGDAAGFVEISGGSGLISSMESAKFWVNTIIEEQTKAEGPEALWQDQTIQRMNKAYTSSRIFQHIKTTADKSNASWDTLFVELRTREKIMKNWEMVKSVLNRDLIKSSDHTE
jgi:flavin-dependent dehydrogenase